MLKDLRRGREEFVKQSFFLIKADGNTLWVLFKACLISEGVHKQLSMLLFIAV